MRVLALFCFLTSAVIFWLITFTVVDPGQIFWAAWALVPSGLLLLIYSPEGLHLP